MTIKMNNTEYPIVTKQMLQENSLEVCEFCDEAFTNRYDSIIHTATHIIIPLMKQNCVKCSKCNYQSTSQNALHQHIITEHPLIVKTEKLILSNLEEEKDVKNGDDIENGDVDNKYYEIKSNHNLSKLENEEHNVSEASSDVVVVSESDSGPEDDTVISETIKHETSIEIPSFKDRFVFEHDVISDSGWGEDVEFTDAAAKNNEDAPLILLTNPEVDNRVDELHYHSLIQPKPLFCRYCSAMFLTRYSLIIHEQKHMKFAQKIMGMLCLHCDKYIAGNYVNLSQHIDTKHSKDKYKLYCTKVCNKCGLQYRSYKHHIHNYHFTKCCKINKFVTDNNFKNHLDKCLCHMHVLSVCRPCYVVLKEDHNFKCMTLGIKHMRGVLQECKKCDNKVNEIISVKLSCKIQTKYQCWYVEDKPLTNRDRLKNIRMRMKKLNILSKMYCFVLICNENYNFVELYPKVLIVSILYYIIIVCH